MQHRYAACLSLALLVAAVPSSRAQEFTCTFWLDSLKFDLADPASVERLLNVPKPRLIMPIFTSGHTLFPTRSKVFSCLPRYADRPDLVADIVRQVKANGGEIFLGIECFRWQRAEMDELENILVTRPEWAEVDFDGNADLVKEGTFASPCHPEVRAALQDLIQEVAEKFPDATGILLDPSMGSTGVLAYSKASLDRYREKHKSEAPPPTFAPDDKRTRNDLSMWASDRAELIRDFFFRDIVLELRKNKIKTRFVLAGPANWRGEPPQKMLARPCDWVHYRPYSFVSEVFLDYDWSRTEGECDICLYTVVSLTFIDRKDTNVH